MGNFSGWIALQESGDLAAFTELLRRVSERATLAETPAWAEVAQAGRWTVSTLDEPHLTELWGRLIAEISGRPALVVTTFESCWGWAVADRGELVAGVHSYPTLHRFGNWSHAAELLGVPDATLEAYDLTRARDLEKAFSNDEFAILEERAARDLARRIGLVWPARGVWRRVYFREEDRPEFAPTSSPPPIFRPGKIIVGRWGLIELVEPSDKGLWKCRIPEMGPELRYVSIDDPDLREIISPSQAEEILHLVGQPHQRQPQDSKQQARQKRHKRAREALASRNAFALAAIVRELSALDARADRTDSLDWQLLGAARDHLIAEIAIALEVSRDEVKRRFEQVGR